MSVDRLLLRTVESADGSWRFAVLSNQEVYLAVGMNLAGFDVDVRRVLRIFATASTIALLLLTLAGWFLAQQALRPVTVLTNTAAGITIHDLNRRVPATKADHEFQALIDVINGMLERLERSFSLSTRFSADAAHELRTPLTILQGELEGYLQRAQTGSDEQRRYSALLDEVQRLKSIAQKLLLLSHADAGRLIPKLEPTDLSQQLVELCEDAAILGRDLTIVRNVEPDVRVRGDASLLMQALRNLVDNAVKYNTKGGRIEIHLSASDGQAVVTVRNTVPPGTLLDTNRLFDRFYRGDPAHGRHIDGTGLGLSLAREIVRAHGGELFFEGISDEMVEFRLMLDQDVPSDDGN